MSDQSTELDLQEALWLARPEHAHFRYRPATVREFCGTGYLEIADSVRPGVMDALVRIFGDTIDPQMISRVREALATGGIGIGKQLRPEEDILTPRGWVELKSIKVGDSVTGSDGKATTVTGVYDHEDVQFYRIHFKDGTWIDAGGPHLWTVYIKSTGGKQMPKTVNTEWLYNENLKRGDCYRFRIPIVEPVQYEAKQLPCCAYTVGMFLGDGSMSSGTPRLATHRDDLVETLNNIDTEGVDWSYDEKVGASGGYIIFRSKDNLKRELSNPLARKLHEAGVYFQTGKRKRIPRKYLEASVADRLDLLRGLMDSDGSTCKGRVVFSSSCDGLSSDVMELVRSLGGYCTRTSFDRRGSTEYQVHINLNDVCPFYMKRKAAAWKPRTNQKPARSIVRVEKLEKGPGICISVDAADKLYVTKDFIVTHNTTIASIALPYMVHWVECLKDPAGFFNLMSGSRIAFMMMSTSERQARDVLFDDVKARIDNSPWFAQYCPRDTKVETRIKFPGGIFIIPGGSEETQFEGYNILGGILDEGDSHKRTARKDYANEGWNTIQSRVSSRFTSPELGCHRGLILAIGQKKSNEGFMAKKSKELEKRHDAEVVTMALWESLGWYNYTDNPVDRIIKRETGERKSFFFDTMRKELLVKEDVPYELRSAGHMIEVPLAFFNNFINDPVKALRDLAGIPPEATDPFIPQVDKIIFCQKRWNLRFGEESPVVGTLDEPVFADWFRATDSLRRVIHIDLAFSGDGDALGMAMGHVPEIVDAGDEDKPLIVFDFLLRMKAKPGKEVILANVRRMVYDLKFKLGFNIKVVTMDGFNTTDTMQQFRKKKINAEYLSVDRSKLPYFDLREAIYEERVLFPEYMVKYHHSDTKPGNIAYKELSQLSEGAKKIDHPADGSKDIADCLAGVAHVLMNDTGVRRGAKKINYEGDTVDTLNAEEQIRAMRSSLSVPRKAEAEVKADNFKPATFDEFLEQTSGGQTIPHVDREERWNPSMGMGPW